MRILAKSVSRKQRSYRSRIANGMAALALVAGVVPLMEGTAHAAAALTINFATGSTYSASVNVTYTCDPGSGYNDLYGTIIASPSAASGGALPICDGASHTTSTSGACVIPSGCFNFTPGRYALVYAGLTGPGATVSDSKTLILQAG